MKIGRHFWLTDSNFHEIYPKDGWNLVKVDYSNVYFQIHLFRQNMKVKK